MQFIVRMPKLSPTMKEGTIVTWHKREGEFVKDGELLISIATDKATVEFFAIDEGFLRKILVLEHQTAQLNEPLAIFTSTQDEPVMQQEKEQPEEKKEEKISKTKVPDEKNIVEEKVLPPAIPAPQFVPEPPLESYHFPFPLEDITDRILASPLARKIAKERNLDLTTIKGSGPGGRIMSRDLDLAQEERMIHFGPKELPQILPGTYEEEDPTPLRKIVGERLADAKRFIPHFYVSLKVDMRELIEIKKELAEEGIKLTFNDFILKASALALKEYPQMNSGYNMQNHKIIRFKTVDIAVAVGINDGIITPIIRYADIKNIAQISKESKYLATKAKEGTLQEHEYKGGSFTVSNLGMFGISSFSAIINPPQAAILAVGGIEKEVIIEEGQCCSREVINLSLSIDHRIVDGVQGAVFIKKIAYYLEKPSLLLI
ncbi:MAG: 2-oxo acid dehydrogenase subunit E2 [Parachlamydiales bacterium]|nr:2-oxo acid dehydrogenase subunit E2 [Parachlamydiales bacterium]